jgi:hypothetical protein
LACHLLSGWFFSLLIFRTWRWRRHVLPKRRLTVLYPRIYIDLHAHRCENLKSDIRSCSLSAVWVFSCIQWLLRVRWSNDIHTMPGILLGDVELLLKALAPRYFGTNFQ